jgi:hypothetical protein
MRRVPFEEFLRLREASGCNLLTFKQFCKSKGFPYQVLQYNPSALIACTCHILIQRAGTVFESDGEESSDGSELSIGQAPSVEFHVRHIIVRNKVVREVIEELIDCVLTSPEKRKYGVDHTESLKRLKFILENGFDELGLSDEDLKERIEFAKHVADEMLVEVRRTQAILQDIQEFKKSLRDNSVSDAQLYLLRDVATDFFDAIATIGALMAFGEFELENIFRQEPEFEQFVDGIVEEAEFVLNQRVSTAEDFVRSVLSEAKFRILAMDFPNLPVDDLRALKDFARDIIEKMIEDAVLIAKTPVGKGRGRGRGPNSDYPDGLMPEDYYDLPGAII